jgi:pimeloyl-ACP methyl ester carboxylesterase
MRSRTTSVIVPSLLATAAFALSACSSGSTGPTSQSPSPLTSTAKSTSASAAATGSPQAAAFGDAWEGVTCDTLGLDPAFNDAADCGYVTVPENRAAGSDKTIELAVARVRALGQDAGLPIVFGEGGPGQNGFLNATLTGIASRAAILQNHDYVFFSQRGTSKADPSLQCPDYNAVLLDDAVARKTPDQTRADRRAAFQACIDGFRAKGVDFSAYNTNENAADVADVVKALGYDKIVYEGASYGTWLGQEVAKQYPDILAGLILDGVAPLTPAKWSDITDYTGLKLVWDACAADDACHAAYPDPEAVLTKVIDDLDANPQPVDITLPDGTKKTIQVNGAIAMEALAGGQNPVTVKALPSIVYRMKDGDLQYALSGLLAGYLSSSENSRAMHFAVNCSDDPVTESDATKQGVDAPYASLLAREVQEGVDACAILGVPQLPASSDEALTSDIPTLILQGGLDQATPVAGGDEVAKGLSKVTNAVIPAGTHVQGLSPCGVQIIASFANDPSATPDTSCIDPAVPMQVALRPTVKSADGKGSLSALLPAGLTETAPGNYSDPTHIVVLGAFPKKGDDDASINDLLKQYESVKPLGKITDGPTIAGMPSRHFVGTADGYAPGAGIDVYAFSDDTTTYVIVGFYSDAGTLEPVFRGNQLPALLQSVDVSK